VTLKNIAHNLQTDKTRAANVSSIYWVGRKACLDKYRNAKRGRIRRRVVRRVGVVIIFLEEIFAYVFVRTVLLVGAPHTE